MVFVPWNRWWGEAVCERRSDLGCELAVTAVLPQVQRVLPDWKHCVKMCKRVCMFAWAVRHDCIRGQDIHLWFGCVCVCVCGLWAQRLTGLLLDDSSAGRECVSNCLQAHCHKYTPLSTGWKSNSNMTARDRERWRGGEQKLYRERGTTSCAQTAECSRTFFAKTTIKLENSVRCSSINT